MAETKPKKFVDEINKKLDDFGDKAISKDESSPYGGVGYSWQYLADAVNENLGPDGWYYDLVDLTVEEKGKSFYAEARVKLYLNGDVACRRGVTVGSCVNIGRGDAQKGAITDALKKGFSLFSIGNKAMRGDLGDEKKKSGSKGKPKPTKQGPSAKDARSEVEQKNKLIREILKASEELKLAEERRESLKKKYTGGKPLNEASLEELDKLFSVMLDLQNKAAES